MKSLGCGKERIESIYIYLVCQKSETKLDYGI